MGFLIGRARSRRIAQAAVTACALFFPFALSANAETALDPAFRVRLFESECSQQVVDHQKRIHDENVSISPDTSDEEVQCGTTTQHKSAVRAVSGPEFVTRIEKILRVRKYEDIKLEWEEYISDIIDEIDDNMEDGVLDQDDVEDASDSICRIAQLTVWIAVLDALHGSRLVDLVTARRSPRVI